MTHQLLEYHLRHASDMTRQCGEKLPIQILSSYVIQTDRTLRYKKTLPVL